MIQYINDTYFGKLVRNKIHLIFEKDVKIELSSIQFLHENLTMVFADEFNVTNWIRHPEKTAYNFGFKFDFNFN